MRMRVYTSWACILRFGVIRLGVVVILRLILWILAVLASILRVVVLRVGWFLTTLGVIMRVIVLRVGRVFAALSTILWIVALRIGWCLGNLVIVVFRLCSVTWVESWCRRITLLFCTFSFSTFPQ